MGTIFDVTVVMTNRAVHILFLWLLPWILFSQHEQSIRSAIQDWQIQRNLSVNDQDFEITDQHLSKQSGVHHIYFVQKHNDLQVAGTTSSIHLDLEGKRLHENLHFLEGVQTKSKKQSPSFSPYEAIMAFANRYYVNVNIPKQPKVQATTISLDQVFDGGSISKIDIPIRLIYYPVTSTDLRLAYEFSIQERDGDNWWRVQMDAQNSEILDQSNWTIQCQWSHPHGHRHGSACHRSLHIVDRSASAETGLAVGIPSESTGYRVFPFGVESPSHGSRQLIVDPADSLASPHGWHLDGNLATQGNNVLAIEDGNANNIPDGTIPVDSLLTFDYAFPLDSQPDAYIEAAITNLFYWCNINHDILYQYGFDEASGNFQEDNFGRGGQESDFLNADGQDGSGFNNANMGTGPDGSNPRLQMFLWNGAAGGITFNVQSPASISGDYNSQQASFGPEFFDLTDTLVVVTRNDTTDGCNIPFDNEVDIAGQIAVIDRGDCEFGVKILNAELAGARAVIMVNNVPGNPVTMAPGAVGNMVTIPSVMITQADGESIKNSIGDSTVLVHMAREERPLLDGDFDNAIITHEYVHGLSIRLTGGASDPDCLNNAEQMGEGWSDWYGLMFTMNESYAPEDRRGIGTYVLQQDTDGEGIRPFPYSQDLAINPVTYGDVSNFSFSVPHGIGSIWASMLWDLNWNLIAREGFDPDLYHGTGGNNIALQLVTEGLKFQSCSPGFVDGRDAILMADSSCYASLYSPIIWKTFARRGLGFSASQGTSTSRFDQTQAFDCPPFHTNVFIDSTSEQRFPSGLNWSEAYRQMEDLVNDPCMRSAIIDTIFLAKGTYFPNVLYRDSSLVIDDSTVVIGGFAPGGITHNPKQYPTILSGNVSGVDSLTNSYHVVIIQQGASAVIKDVIIEGGYANGDSIDSQIGGGLLVHGEASLQNVTIRHHYAKLGGAAVFVSNTGFLNMVECTIEGSSLESGSFMTDQGGQLNLINCQVKD